MPRVGVAESAFEDAGYLAVAIDMAESPIVEAGRLSDEPLAIDDSVRMVGSPVFLDLAGTTQARSVLEAMIAHSDNTATDLATRTVGADRVRALIAEAGLRSIRIPDSTRLFVSYILGAPAGVDLGWPGIRRSSRETHPALSGRRSTT